VGTAEGKKYRQGPTFSHELPICLFNGVIKACEEAGINLDGLPLRFAINAKGSPLSEPSV
jgi:hypothetical protein